MKPVEELTNRELFDRLSIAIYYGNAMKATFDDGQDFTGKSNTRYAAEQLLWNLRQDKFLCLKMEKEGK